MSDGDKNRERAEESFKGPPPEKDKGGLAEDEENSLPCRAPHRRAPMGAAGVSAGTLLAGLLGQRQRLSERRGRQREHPCGDDGPDHCCADGLAVVGNAIAH
jgi:hypothetical protein